MKFLCAFCVLCGLTLPARALDREAFTFTNYNLDVRVEPEQQRLGVRGKITLRNDSTAAQKYVVLQISSTLNWKSIQVAGKATEFEVHGLTSDIDHTGALSEAIVTLPHEVPPKGTVELDIGYEGLIPLDTTRLTRIGVPEDKAKHSDWDQISKSFTAVRGIGHVAWYPVATEAAILTGGNGEPEAVGRWKAREQSTHARINLCFYASMLSHLPVPVMNDRPAVGVPGASFGGTTEGDATSCQEHIYEKLGESLPLFLGADYTELDRGVVSVSYLSGHAASAESYGLAADLAVPLVTDWFGAPKEKAEVLDLLDPDAAPFESGTMLLTPLTSKDSRSYQSTAIHQLTHAAFSSSRLWVYEGLAHFAQALEREQQDERQGALEFMGRHQAAITEAETSLAAERDRATTESLISTSTEEFYRNKAMYVWWMLRDMLGDAVLKKALVSYVAIQDKEPAYLQHLIEAQSKRDLQWFFDDWVYHDRGLPDFRIESALFRQAPNGTSVVTVTVENLGDAGAEVPIMARMPGGDVTRRIEVRAKSKAAIRIETAAAPLEIVVNDGSVPESDSSNNTYKIEAVNH